MMLGSPKRSSQGDQEQLRAVAARYGLDRVGWVRLVHSASATTCELHGSRHHRLMVVAVDVQAAVALAQAGVPVVVRGANTQAA